MTDYTMCPGESCHLKERCYRYTARPDPFWQSWFETPPFDEGSSTCECYMQ